MDNTQNAVPDITALDKNFRTETSFAGYDIDFFNVREEPFEIHGLLHDGERYRRIPLNVSNDYPGVRDLSIHTAGGRVCFVTDSPYIAVSAVMPGMYLMPHMTFLGSAGFDMYVRRGTKQTYAGSFIPDKNNHESVHSLVKLGDKTPREIIIDFPLYSGVKELFVGIEKGSTLEKWSGYSRKTPMVFYGSSITQGGCASAPGTCYEAIISRRFDSDYINLGFSGNAKGEPAILEYIAGLDMSLFLYDYDYNAPSCEHLEKTHYAGYAAVRRAHPDIPIIMASRPNYSKPDEAGRSRRDIIAASYERALADGDKNVYFADGKKEFAAFYDEGFAVDGTHPTDHGFYVMAKVFGDIIEKAISKK
ncbi:MAG: SGNH/GDSL hydrolase family protein [Clostridiales bacterium]|nr:SGNH/GDSL hydrolase family protein [Clostridiales bacterium]